jgi:hypothetical protein
MIFLLKTKRSWRKTILSHNVTVSPAHILGEGNHFPPRAAMIRAS